MHAGPDAPSLLEPLLVQLRQCDQLTERKPGTFYLKSKAFLHFHEDPAGIFADVKLDLQSFTRMRVMRVSDMIGETGPKILRAFGDGECDPAALAEMKNVRIRASADEIAKSLHGNWRAERLVAFKPWRCSIYDNHRCQTVIGPG